MKKMLPAAKSTRSFKPRNLSILLLALSLFCCQANKLFGAAHKAVGHKIGLTGKKSCRLPAADITSINTLTSSPTNAATVQFSVTFGTAVTGVTADNFSLTTNGPTGATISSVSGSGQTYTVTINTGTGDGTIGLNLANGTNISPAITTALPFAGQSYTIDKSPPQANSLYDQSSNTDFTKAVVGDVITLYFGTTEPIQQPATVTIAGHSVIPVNTGGNSYTASYQMTSSDVSGRVHFTCQFTDLAGNVGPLYNDLGAGDDIEFSSVAPSASDVTFVSNNADNATAVVGNRVTLTFTASEAIQTPAITIAGHAVTTTSKGGNTYTASYIMTSGDASGNIPFTATLTDASTATTNITNVTTGKNILFNATPSVTLTGTVAALTTVPGTPSASRQFKVSGFNLTAGVTVQAPTGFEVSTDNSTFSRTVTVGSGVVLPATVIYIRLEGTALSGTYGSQILADSPGASEAKLTPASSTIGVFLASLAISSGTLYPSFSISTINYKVNVANAVSSITVTARNDDGVAPIQVNGASVVSGYPSPAIPLAVGANTITVTVTSNDNTLTKVYTITLTRAPSANNFLKAIGPSVSGLTPGFSGTTTSYTLNVANSVASMTVKPVAADSSAVIRVNGTVLASGSVSAPIALVEGGQKVINIAVTAQSGASKTYTVTVNRAPSNNASLVSINPSIQPLSPAFNANTTSYALSVNNTKTSITVTPYTSNVHSTMTVNGATLASGTVSAPIALTSGVTTPINIVVTAQDGTTVKTYTISVTRGPSSVATLSAINLSAGTLSPAFGSGILAYTAGVVNSVASITVSPIATDAGATITVNGTTVASGTASAPIALTEGAVTPVHVVVTAQNGSTTQTYTINVTRGPSTDASLSSMGPQYGPLSPAFFTNTTSYNLSVPNSKASMTVTPVTGNAHATIKVNGIAVASGAASAPVSLAEGGTTNISVVVTAQDGATTKTYTVAVTRAPSANAGLAAFGQQYGSLSPVFNTNTASYTLTLGNAKTGITFTPVASDANATVKINGTPVASGNTSAPVALTEGASTAVNIVVTSQDGTATKSYTINVNNPPSAVATLSAISISAGLLDSAFAVGGANYTAVVESNSTTSITITPTATDANATITINGTPVASGTASAPIALAEGNSLGVSIVVTAQNGTTTRTYTMVVTRSESGNAGLSQLQLSTGALSPAFDPATTVYTVNVNNAVTSTTVQAVTADVNASIAVNGKALASGATSGPIALAVGSNTINVTVTAQDGTTNKTYTTTVTRAAGGADSFSPESVNERGNAVTLAQDGIRVHQGVSPNGDGVEDFLQIDNINRYPDNRITIMNRNGQVIYEAAGYNNSSKVFDGHSSKNGKMQFAGTYFYQLDYTAGGVLKHKTGYLVLKY